MAFTLTDVNAAFGAIEALLDQQPITGVSILAAGQAGVTALATPIANFADAPTTAVLTRILNKAAAATPSPVPIAEL